MASKITERYEYKTDIIASYSGREQRIKTRYVPRHYLSYDYDAMDSYQAQWLRGIHRLPQASIFYFPMWQSPIKLKTKHYRGERYFSIEPSGMFALRRCDWIDVFVRDQTLKDAQYDIPTGNKPMEVSGYGTAYGSAGEVGLINFDDPIMLEYDVENTYIYPLRQVSVQPTNGLNYVFSNGTTTTINLEDILEPIAIDIPDKYMKGYEQDNGYWNRFNLPEELNGRQVFTLMPQWLNDSDVGLSVGKVIEKLDNETGIFVYDYHDKNKRSYDAQTFDFYAMNRNQINNTIKFFLDKCGRLKSFYIPSWVNDFNLAKDLDAGSNFMYVHFAQLDIFYNSTARNKKIVIFDKHYGSTILDIQNYGYSMLDGREVGRLVLKDAIPKSISMDEVLMISYLNLVRFDHDDFQIEYESDDTAHTSWTLKEVDDEL